MFSRSRVPVSSGTLAAIVGISLGSAAGSAELLAGAPSCVVADHAQSDAANIEAVQGVELGRSAGRAVPAACDASAGRITVLTVEDSSVHRDGAHCFRVTGKTGFLTLELSRVFTLEAAGHSFGADLTANGTTRTVAVDKDGFEPVGEGTVGGARPVLVEIRETG